MCRAEWIQQTLASKSFSSVSQIWASQFGSVLYVVPSQFILNIDTAYFSQNFKLKVKNWLIQDYLKFVRKTKRPPFSKVEQSLIKANVLKFHFISFLPVSSQGHFKVVSANSKVRFCHPDLTRGFYQYKKKLLDLEVFSVVIS